MNKKNLLCLFICTLSFCNLLSKQQNRSDQFMNLDFFEVVDGKPTHWVFSNNGYKVSLIDQRLIVIEDSLKIEGQFGMALNQIPVELVRGKTVKITCLIRRGSFEEGLKVGLWAAVDKPNGPIQFSECTKEIHLESIFHTDSIEMKVDNKAQSFNFGVMAQGRGGVGFGCFSVSIDGVKYDDTQSKELTQKQKKWLKENILPLKTTNPDETDNTDLRPLIDMLGDTKVVALGEVTHGAKEIFELKDRMIRYLAQNRGYDVFSIEENQPECYVINQNVLVNGEDNIEEQMKKYLIWPWRTKQVEAMLEWMRSYKQDGGNIQFTGIDNQIYWNVLPFLKDMFAEYPQYLLQLDSIKTQIMDFMRNRAMNGFKPDTLMRSNIVKSVNQLSLMTEKDKWNDKTFLDMNLKILKQSMFFEKRDHYMADNFLDLMKINSQSKFIIWAHNLHLNKKNEWLGGYLNQALGNDYLNVAFVVDNGKYIAWHNGGIDTYEVQPAFKGTLDYYLNSIDVPIFALDLRKVRADKSEETQWFKDRLLERHTGAGYINNEFAPFDINRYDILIFIKHVNAAELIH